jgi:hypothetical protein
MPEMIVSPFLTKLLIMVPLMLLGQLAYQWGLRSTFKEKAKTTASLDGFVMAPSRAVRYIVFGCTAIFVALGAPFVYFLLPSPEAALGLGAFYYGLIFLMVAPTLYDFRRRVHVSREGLQSFSPWTGRKSATWYEVESVSFRKWGQTIRIHLRIGGIVAIPCSTMNGLQQLEAAMREHLQPSVFEHAFEEYRTYRGRAHGQ